MQDLDKKDLSVITVTWNSKNYICEQLRSVQGAILDFSFEQIVVDNASGDSTPEIVEQQFPDVKLIKNAENKGFSAANNQGFAESCGEFLLFLNPDMKAFPGSIHTLVSYMKLHPEVGIAGGKLVHENGTLNREALPRRFPGLFDQLAIVTKLAKVLPFLLQKYLISDFDGEKEQEVDSVRGSFLCMRREISERLGFAFDPRYYIWFEDVDVCKEAKRMGFKVVYVPQSVCVDYVGKSFQKRKTFWKQKNFTKSMITYFQKWEPSWKWPIFFMLRPVILAFAWIRDHIF